MSARLPVLHRGHLAAAGLWFPPPVDARVRARVLEHWRTGCTLHAALDGLLLRFPSPRHLAASVAPGLIVTEEAGRLGVVVRPPPRVSAPPSPAVPLPDPGTLTLLWQGCVHTLPIAALAAVDPAPWIDLTRFVTVAVEPLGPLPAPAPVVATFDARVALRRPPSAAEAEALRVAIARSAERSPPNAVARAMAGLGGRLLSWVQRLGAATAVGGGGGGRASGSPAAGRALAPPGPPPGPSWMQRLARRIAAPLWGPLLGAAHGRHLGKLFDLFDAGKLEEALRNAIPLGGGGADLGPSWSLPSPRANLGLGPLTRGPTSTIGLGPDIFGELRRLYERAFEKLLAEGKLDDAVFVLVELLREYGRAVELLEKHERFELAAEIAESGELPPAIAIRLWLRAGKPERAVLLARRTGAFADAVNGLVGPHPELARTLRRAWAEHLASRGDYAGACEVAWSDKALRPLAVPWLDAALAVGGPSGARLIAYLLRGTPELFGAARERVLPLLDGEGYDEVRLRIAAASGLLEVATDESRALLRPLLRAIVADQARQPGWVEVALVHRLRDQVGEPALAADIPALALPPTVWRQRSEPLTLSFAAGDRGTAAVHDLSWSEETGLLVACGELGARSLGANGKVRARYDEPVYRLVPSDAGGRAIGVAIRDWGVRLCRLDLAAGTVARWHDAKYSAFADTTDGNLWFVAEGDSLLALDVLADSPRALWRVNRLPGPVRAIRRSATQMSAILGDKERERWVHSLPAIRLSERRRTLDAVASGVEGLLANGDLLAIGAPAPGPGPRLFPWALFASNPDTANVALRPSPRADRGLAPLAVLGDAQGASVRRVASFLDGSGVVVALWLGEVLALVIELGGVQAVPAVRLQGDALLVGDELGRALVFDLGRGVLLRDLRVS